MTRLDAQGSFMWVRGSFMSPFIRNEGDYFQLNISLTTDETGRDRTFQSPGSLGNCAESCLATSPPHGGLVPTPEALGSDCQLG